MARDPGDLYQVSPGAPEPDDDLVMLYYLDGFIDAGAAGRLLTTHLTEHARAREVARFDVDSLIDYRSRRPVMTLRQGPLGGLRDARARRCPCSATRTGTPFLLLNGLEPDREWEAFTSRRAGS